MSEPADSPSILPEDDASAPAIHSFSHVAMGCPFAVIIVGQEADYARKAAGAAFAELDGLENELSHFKETSEVSQINALSVGELLRVTIDAFDCLKLAARIHRQTGGAFDVTVGPLLKCWVEPGGGARRPSAEELAKARACTGMGLLVIDEEEHAVAVKADGVKVDLGGIGKGYALDRMADVLRKWGVKTARLDSGKSTVLAMGSRPGKKGWSLGICDPEDPEKSLFSVGVSGRAVSGSGVQQRGRHIIDPRTGRPAAAKLNAWAAAPTAAEADALSTAFFVMSPEEVEQYCRQHGNVSGILAVRGAGGVQTMQFGRWDLESR